MRDGEACLSGPRDPVSLGQEGRKSQSGSVGKISLYHCTRQVRTANNPTNRLRRCLLEGSPDCSDNAQPTMPPYAFVQGRHSLPGQLCFEQRCQSTVHKTKIGQAINEMTGMRWCALVSADEQGRKVRLARSVSEAALLYSIEAGHGLGTFDGLEGSASLVALLTAQESL